MTIEELKGIHDAFRIWLFLQVFRACGFLVRCLFGMSWRFSYGIECIQRGLVEARERIGRVIVPDEYHEQCELKQKKREHDG